MSPVRSRTSACVASCQARAEARRGDVRLWVRSWPLEIVNGKPLDPGFIAEEVDELRKRPRTRMFRGFTEAAFPATSVPALALAAQGYARGSISARQSFSTHDLLFEQGEDVAGRLCSTGLRHVTN